MNVERPDALRISVLGPLLAHTADAVVELGPTRRRATLAALVIDAGRPVPQDVLADRIWDGAPPESASTSVHAYVSRLRSAMRTAAGQGDEKSPIRTESAGYRLAVAPSDIDAHRFAELVRQARKSWSAGDAAATAETARAALALWRGDTAYADVTARFAVEAAGELAGLRDAARVLAIDAELLLGRHAELVDEIRMLVRSAPYAEHLHANLMVALYRSGRQADALAHFGLVRERLRDELGVDPGPELQDVHRDVLTGDASLRDPIGAVLPAERTVSPAVPGPPTSQAMIGRSGESARLQREIGLGWRQAARLVVLAGEAGIGKTRLLEHVVAEQPDAVSVWGRCWQHEGAPRMWPWVQVLRELRDAVGHDAFAEASDGVGGSLAGIVPELLATRGSLPDGSSGGSSRDSAGGSLDEQFDDVDSSELRLLDAVATVLRRLGAQRPVLVLLEDLHWADPTSSRMLEYAIKYLTGPGVSFVATVRWPSDEATAATGSLLAALAIGPRVSRIDLTGFGVDDVRDYVASRTGGVIDTATIEALLDRTDGNPFFLGELVRLIVDDDSPREVPEQVPGNVRSVVLARVERIPAAHRAVLDAAAVVGRTFDLGLLQAVGDFDEDAVDEAVDAATEFGTVVSETGRPGEHRFAHALVQQTLLEAIGPSRRRRLHGRAAVELRRRADDPVAAPDAARIVHHLTSAGTTESMSEAIDLCVSTAVRSRRRGDIASAQAMLMRALDAVSRSGAAVGPDHSITELTVRLHLLALYTLLSPSAEDARNERDRVLGIAREIGSAAELLFALQAVLAEASLRGDFALVDAVAEELRVGGNERDDDVLRAAGALAAGQSAFHRGRPRAALVANEEALQRFDALDDAGLLAGVGEAFALHPRHAARAWRAFALSLLGDHAAADAQLVELDALDQPPDRYTRLYISVVLGLLEASRDDPAAVANRVATARAEQARVGALGDGLPYLEVLDAWSRFRAGAEADAGERIAGILTATAVLPTMSQRPLLMGLHADVLIRAGRPQEALPVLSAALDEAFAMDERWSDALLLRLTAAATRATGHEAAATFLDRQAADATADLTAPSLRLLD